MKKSLILLSVIFIISSCFSSGDDEKLTDSIEKIFETKEFSIIVPSKWEILRDTTTILPKPAYGDIVFDVVSLVKIDGIYRNLLVIKQKIEEYNVNSVDYIVGNYLGSKNEYFYIKELFTKNVKIDNKNTKIYIFEAKYSEDTPILKYMQTGIICNKTGFLITIALEKSNNNLERYQRLLGSFKCKSEEKNNNENK